MFENYKPIKKYKVFVIVDNTATSFTKTHVLEDANIAFDNYDDAKEWIENNGYRQTDYVIIEVFRKL